MTKVCVTSPYSVGCSFVDWSIHFLSGQTRFYSAADRAWIALASNPLTQSNAHGHKKNHPGGLKRTKDYLALFDSVAQGELFSIYPYPLNSDLVADQLGLLPVKTLDRATLETILHHQTLDYARAIDHCLETNCKVIYVNLHNKNSLYLHAFRSTERLFFSAQTPTSIEEHRSHLDQLFFQDSLQAWQDRGLTDIWDLRERRALQTRPFEPLWYDAVPFDKTLPHLWIDSEWLWYDGLRTLEKIMLFCNLEIDSARWPLWVDVYRQWQNLQFKILHFVYDCKHIVDAIVNNWYYEIPDLNFDQEVIIQHCLIYQHGLNLKTWQLEKFPNNTQDLHLLLEPNIHNID